MSSNLPPPKLYQTRGARLAEICQPTLRYWFQTEVHVFALSMAAAVLLSVFPFLIVIMSLCRYGLHWQAGVKILYLALADYFPGDMGEFIRRNLTAVVQGRGPFQYGQRGVRAPRSRTQPRLGRA